LILLKYLWPIWWRSSRKTVPRRNRNSPVPRAW